MNYSMKNEEIIKALNWRFAAKVFDPNKKVSDEDIHTILESARLSPSSNGFEPWHFTVVNDPAVRAQIFETSKQPKVTEASHLVVIAYKTNPELLVQERLERTAKIQHQDISELESYKTYLKTGIDKKVADGSYDAWAKAQTYIPIGTMVLTASLLGVDNGPMEGFDPMKVDEILGLKEKNLKSVTMIAFGYRGTDPADPLESKPKVRRAFDEAIEFI